MGASGVCGAVGGCGVTGFEGAACAEIPREVADVVFFSSAPRDRHYAKRICDGCPAKVREACLAMALDAERGASIYERHGVFGGTVPSERLRMQKEAS